MSKTPGGPAACSFTNPRKTGWLYKHGGSGISSHWKKRWFVADDHYLFYYKGPNDKKPVGILCLPEYGSCQKADVKEWKKPFSFVLNRTEGNQEITEGVPGKDYVLYSDSEGDMITWIKVLQEEIKHTGFINGGPGIYGVGSKVKVDQQALEEVTKAASDGPKLTHLTAQRPRVKGRRPPKRYATYHEEDKDDSPPDTPTSDIKLSSTPPLTTPPSPTASPTSHGKGHRPSVPLMPKQRSSTSSPPPTKESPKSIKKLPPTPPSKVLLEKEEEVAETARLPKQRPMPPKRPLKARSSTDTPAPRPIPAPRRISGKDVVKSPGIDSVVDHTSKQVDKDLQPQALTTDVDNEDERIQEDTHVPEVTASDDERNTIEQVGQKSQTDADLPTGDDTKDSAKETSSPSALPLGTTDNHTSILEKRTNTDVIKNTGHLSRTISSTDEYEHMRPGVTKDKNHDGITVVHDRPEERSPDSPASSTRKDEAGYAIPCPVTTHEEAAYDVPMKTEKTGTQQIPILITENEERLAAGKENSSTPPDGSRSDDQLTPFKIERDALGYAKVIKKKSGDNRAHSESPAPSDEEQPPPTLWTGMENSDNVPSTLHQSREILRLAQVMKQEVEEMRREVQRELELARRERQDAEILKKNAAEILRMAKEKLHQKPSA